MSTVRKISRKYEALPDEHWYDGLLFRVIPNTDGKLAASRCGMFRGLYGHVKPYKRPDGYYTITFILESTKKQRNVRTHRAMAMCWLPNPNNKPEVNHIDGCPGNWQLANLEWVTAKENHRHAINTGLITNLPRKGEQGFQCGPKNIAQPT